MKRVVAEMHMEEVSICYGMTETSPVSTQTRRDDDLERRTGTVGRVMPHIEVKVIDPATGGVTLERGKSGELCTRGYSVMLGYWDQPERTAEAIDAGGRWMHTGDLAVMREDGYVQIVGRIKDVIIRGGGENIYPREIEEFLYRHPKIADVQVVGVPDERYGEECWPASSPADPRRPAGPGGRTGLLRRAVGALQGAAPAPDPGDLPDDGQRQGPQDRTPGDLQPLTAQAASITSPRVASRRRRHWRSSTS